MQNPVIYADYPDPDLIRVNDRYYMITTTMHMFPGGDLLTSRDLVHWELCCHVFTELEGTPAQHLNQGHVYGKGMWAATLRYHRGVFHILFVANDTGKTYHYTATVPEGPWEYHPVEGFYHDASLLFDDDGKVYLAYGNREIRIREMEPDLSRPKKGGLDRIALVDEGNVMLGFEGCHFYKLHGKYYLFLIHWPKDGHARRTEACYAAPSIDGVFEGGDILDDDMGFFNQGVAQGGIVDTPDGKWYAMLFQDHGACGRMPVLVPMYWENDFPVFPSAPPLLEGFPSASDDPLKPLVSSDALRGESLADWWQWNHLPDMSRVQCTPDGLVLHTGLPALTLEDATNTLTQRTTGPKCSFQVNIDVSGLKRGQRSGLCALQGQYAACAIERDEEDGFSLVFEQRTAEGFAPDYTLTSSEAIPLPSPRVSLRAEFDFTDMKDQVCFFLKAGGKWRQIGRPHQLRYRLDHFMGVRIGLFCYAAVESDTGEALFTDFVYQG
ncbi:MAG: glycosyl hydrolase 43 family protein [Clostridiales bacterium]|nr:glycosyl hydrolase 43 family protein [Clostridiales bacterium]